MQITVNKKEYALHFGLEFLRQIDNYLGVTIDVDGQPINTRQGGLPFMVSGLSQYSLHTVFDVLKAALATEKSKPSNASLEEYLMTLSTEDKEKYKSFVDELSEEIKKAPLVKAQLEISTD